MLLQRGKTWHLVFQHNGRKIKRTTGCSNKKEAEKVARQIKKDFLEAQKQAKVTKHSQRTFGDGLLKWAQTDMPTSMKSHANNTREFLENVPLTSDIVAATHDMRDEMAKTLGNPTVNRRLSVVIRILNKAYKEWMWLETDLASQIKKLPENCAREIYLSREEVDELVAAVRCPEIKKVLLVAAFTGLRQGEILNLTERNWHPPFIRLHGDETKNKKGRSVPVIEEMHDMITLPFQTTYHRLRRAFEKAREAIGRPEIRFHDLRHTFASWLAEDPDVPLAVIRDLLGHCNISVTNRYAHLQGNHYAAVSGALGGTKSGTSTRVTH